MARFHCPCVASYLAIQKPLLSVTFTWSSQGRRSGSPRGLPMVNVPGGHQQNLTPAMTRSSPALRPPPAGAKFGGREPSRHDRARIPPTVLMVALHVGSTLRTRFRLQVREQVA